MYGRGVVVLVNIIYNHNFVRFANYPQTRINLESEQKNVNSNQIKQQNIYKYIILSV